MWLMEKFLTFISDCLISLAAALMNVMVDAMEYFIPNHGEYGVPSLLTDPNGFGFDFMTGQAYTIIGLAFAIVIIKFCFNLMSDLKPGLPSARDEGLISHIGRFMLACAMVGAAYDIMYFIMSWGNELVHFAFEDDQLTSTFGTEFTTDIAITCGRPDGGALGTGLTATVFVPLVLICAIAWNQLKLFVEIAERLITTTLITMFAPLGFCTIVSQDWVTIGKRYFQMVFSSYLVLYIDVFFMRMAYQGMLVTINPSANKFEMYTWRLLAVLAILIVAQKADQVVRDAGLSVAQTGSSLFGALAASYGAAKLAGRAISKAGRALASHNNSAKSVSSNAVNTSKNTKQANSMLGAVVGKGNAEKLAKNGNFSFADKEATGIRTRSVNGVAVAEGTAKTKSGKCFDFATVPGQDLGKYKGMGVIQNKDGSMIAISGKGQATWDALTPGGYSTPNVDANKAAKAERSANDEITKAYNNGGLTKENLESAAQKIRSAYTSSPVEQQESVSAATAMLGDATKDKTVVGAWHSEGDPAGEFHAMMIDNNTGMIESYDIAASCNADRIDALQGREITSSCETEVGTMQAYKTSLAPTASPASERQFSDFDGRKLELPEGDRIEPYEGVPGVYKRIHTDVQRDKSGEVVSTSETVTGHYVPASKYNISPNASMIKIDGEPNGFIPVNQKNTFNVDIIDAARRIHKYFK